MESGLYCVAPLLSKANSQPHDKDDNKAAFNGLPTWSSNTTPEARLRIGLAQTSCTSYLHTFSNAVRVLLGINLFYHEASIQNRDVTAFFWLIPTLARGYRGAPAHERRGASESRHGSRIQHRQLRDEQTTESGQHWTGIFFNSCHGFEQVPEPPGRQ